MIYLLRESFALMCFVLLAAFTIAALTGAHAQAPKVPPLTLAEKVAIADYVIVGRATQVKFVQYPAEALVEVDPSKLADPEGYARLLTVEVQQWLKSRKQHEARSILVMPRQLPERYLNRDLIYFLRSNREHGGRLDFFFVPLRRWPAHTEGLNRLQDVQAAIEREAKSMQVNPNRH